MSAQNPVQTDYIAYDAFGYRLASFLPLPAPQVRVDLLDWSLIEDPALPLQDHVGGYEQLVAGGTLEVFEAPGFARFTFRDRQISVQPAVGLEASDLVGVLTGALQAMLLARAGQPVLHGTTLRLRDRAVVVCGNAGAGKSTQAAYLALNGWTLHADDVAPIRWQAGEAVIFPGFDSIRLFPDSLRLLGLNPDSYPPLHRRATKRLASIGAGRTGAGQAIPIAGVVMLEEADGYDLRRLSEREATVALLNMQHPTAAKEVEASPAGKMQAFQDYARLARQVPVVQMRRAKTLENLRRGAESLASALGF